MERTNLHHCYGFTQKNAHSVHSIELGTMETHLCLTCTSCVWILLLLKRQYGVSAEKWFLVSLCSVPSVLSAIVSLNLLLFTHLILISVLHSHSSAFQNSTSLCLVLLYCMVHGEEHTVFIHNSSQNSFWDRVPRCSLEWPEAHYGYQASLKHFPGAGITG